MLLISQPNQKITDSASVASCTITGNPKDVDVITSFRLPLIVPLLFVFRANTSMRREVHDGLKLPSGFGHRDGDGAISCGAACEVVVEEAALAEVVAQSVGLGEG
jgi:hypothetical protein